MALDMAVVLPIFMETHNLIKSKLETANAKMLTAGDVTPSLSAAAAQESDVWRREEVIRLYLQSVDAFSCGSGYTVHLQSVSAREGYLLPFIC